MLRYVYEGPRWYRTRIRSRGPFLALLPPAVLGLLAVASLTAGDSQASGYAGLLLGVFAAPALLAVGVPFSSTEVIPIGIALLRSARRRPPAETTSRDSRVSFDLRRLPALIRNSMNQMMRRKRAQAAARSSSVVVGAQQQGAAE